MDRRLALVAGAALAALAALAACRGAARPAAAGGAHDAGGAAVAAKAKPSAATALGDGGVVSEIDAAPIHPGDVLEGSAAEAAMAEALARDAGEPSSAPTAAPAPAAPGSADDPLAIGLGNDGVAGFRLGLARAEVAKRLGHAVPFVRVPRPTADAPLTEDAIARNVQGLPWLHLRLLAGRVVELEVLARDGRALTDEGIGVGSSFEEAILAHGEARAVADEKTGRVRGWVLADLPGLLWIAAGPPVAGNLDTAPPEGARVARVLVLGAEALAPPD